MKKAMSIILALVLCLSMSVMAFAEDANETADPAVAVASELEDAAATIEDKAEDVKAEISDTVGAAIEKAKDLVDDEKVAEVGEKAKSIFSELLNTATDFEGLKAMLSDVNPEQLNDVLKTTAESINKLSGGKLNLDGSLDGIREALKDTDLSAGMPAVADAFFAGLEKAGVSRDDVVKKLQASKILNAGAKLYTYGAAPAPSLPDNPKTGSTAAIAVFAVLSVAAAAAFVCGKKED